MRLTLSLSKESLSWLLKRVRRHREIIRIQEGIIPSYAKEAGLEIINPNKHFNPPPRFPTWTPPITDDPSYSIKAELKDHPDYHEQPVYKIIEVSHLIEGQKQAEILTKTCVVDSLPEKVTNNIGKIRLPKQDELVQRFIMQANMWDPTKDKVKRWHLPETPRIWKFKAEYGIKKRKTNKILLQNMIRLCENLKEASSELGRMRQLTRFHPVTVLCDFKDNKQLHIDCVHDFMLSSDQSLSPFASPSQIEETAQKGLPDIFPLEPTIDIETSHIYNEKNQTGWLPGVSLRYPHTLFHNHRDYWKISQKNAKALLFCFANCASVAKAKYGDDVKVLPEPITLQWVGCDEDTLHFICYQLNTLDFTDSSDSGVKNIAWIDSGNKLYNKILPKRAMLRNTKYEDYDPDVFDKFLAFYLTDSNVKEIQEYITGMHR